MKVWGGEEEELSAKLILSLIVKLCKCGQKG